MHANTKQSMESGSMCSPLQQGCTPTTGSPTADRCGPQADGNALSSFSTKVKHQAGQASNPWPALSKPCKDIEKVGVLLSCFSCLGRNSQEELWAAPFNANAAANSGAPVWQRRRHNPMQLLPHRDLKPTAARGSWSAIPRTVYNRNPFLQGGAGQDQPRQTIVLLSIPASAAAAVWRRWW